MQQVCTGLAVLFAVQDGRLCFTFTFFKHKFCPSMIAGISLRVLSDNIKNFVAELLHADGQTDMTKLVVVFHSFANAPKKTTAV
jgi:hypothetical protein